MILEPAAILDSGSIITSDGSGASGSIGRDKYWEANFKNVEK